MNEKYNAFPVRTASKKLCVDDNDQNPVTVTCNAINQMPYHSNTQFNNGTVTTHFLVHSTLYRWLLVPQIQYHHKYIALMKLYWNFYGILMVQYICICNTAYIAEIMWCDNNNHVKKYHWMFMTDDIMTTTWFNVDTKQLS